MDMANGEPGCQYYEQLFYNNSWLKVGDFVYIASHGLVRHRVGRWGKFITVFYCKVYSIGMFLVFSKMTMSINELSCSILLQVCYE